MNQSQVCEHELRRALDIMEASALDAELVALVEKSIAQLAPTVQQLCGKDDICMALQSLGCIRVSDLQLLLSGDLLIIQAALAPTPIMFLMMLKRLALASAAASPGSAAAATASPAPGQSLAFQTPTNNTEGQIRCLNRPRTFLSRSLGRLWPNFGTLPGPLSVRADSCEKIRVSHPFFSENVIRTRTLSRGGHAEPRWAR